MLPLASSCGEVIPQTYTPKPATGVHCKPALNVIAQSNPLNPMVSQALLRPWNYLHPHPLFDKLKEAKIIREFASTEHRLCAPPSCLADCEASFNNLQVNTLHLRAASRTVIGKEYENRNRYRDALSADEWLFRLNDPLYLLSFDDWKNQILDWGRVGDCPYINASCIDFSGEIITQGPLEKTAAQFWQMTWLSNLHTIVMLTDFEEAGKSKCHPYFPTELGKVVQYGKQFIFTVQLTGVLHRNGFFKRDFVLTHNHEHRNISHVQCIDWNDQQPYPIDRLFWLVVYTSHLHQGEAQIMHGSAGVGRAGVFFACRLIYRIWKQSGQSLHIDVDELIKYLRYFCPGLLVTAAQYRLIFEFINHLNTQPS